MAQCLFVSDLHGRIERYDRLFKEIRRRTPRAVFFGGDLLPHPMSAYLHSGFHIADFIDGFLLRLLEALKADMGEDYPEFFFIFGNDDPRIYESSLIEGENNGLLKYVNQRKAEFDNLSVYGYSYVPPTPFLLKDWERYDVSRFYDSGCVALEKGKFTIEVEENIILNSTIKEDLSEMTKADNLSNAIMLFHSPPYRTTLDIHSSKKHIGSIAIRRFIENRQPLLTLHGHIHESVSISNSWKDMLGKTYLFSAAHDKKELALVVFDTDKLDSAERFLL